MENIEESRATPGIFRRGLSFGINVSPLKYALGTLLVLSFILGLRVLEANRDMTPPVVAASVLPANTGVSRHSTLSIEVFQKFIRQSTERMYPRLSREIVEAAIKYSDKYDLSPILVLAVVEAESQYYPFAISKKNAKGLMQINTEVNQALLLQEGILKEPSDIFDPDRNMEAGCFLLRRFLNESSDLNAALDRYLGADSLQYKAEIHQVMGKVLLLGITEELNKTSQHQIQPIVKVEAPQRQKNK